MASERSDPEKAWAFGNLLSLIGRFALLTNRPREPRHDGGQTHTTATFTQWIGGSESNRQVHSSPPSRPIQSCPVVVPK